jgi:hypothetical protein
MIVQNLNAARARGAYGFRLTGIPEPDPLLVDAPPGWPALEVRAHLHTGPAPAEAFGEDSACLPLRTGGWVEFERAAGRVTFWLAEPLPPAAIAHPLLGVAAIVPAFWLDRESFHAAAFEHDGGAWAVVADREAGKSSLIATLALAGVPVVCDDILVLDRLTALAGPRSVDLREPAAVALGAGEPLGRIGDRDRWRLPLGPVAPELPLRGWITLRWSEEPAVRRLGGSDRLRAIAAHRAFLLGTPDPGWLLELSSLPVLEFSRPRRWDAAGEAAQRLLEALTRAAPG